MIYLLHNPLLLYDHSQGRIQALASQISGFSPDLPSRFLTKVIYVILASAAYYLVLLLTAKLLSAISGLISSIVRRKRNSL